MSSESEDEFQSADEGSDCEDFESSQPIKEAPTVSQKHTSSPLPHTADFLEEETYISESHNNKGSSIHLDCTGNYKANHVGKSSSTTQVQEKHYEEEINQKERIDDDKEIHVAVSGINDDKEIHEAVSGLSIEDTENHILTNENLLPSHAEDAQKCDTLDKDKCTANDKEKSKECALSNSVEDIVEYADQSICKEESEEGILRGVKKRGKNSELLVGDISHVHEHNNETVFQEENEHKQKTTKDGKDTCDHIGKMIKCDDVKTKEEVEKLQEMRETEEITKIERKKEIEEVENTKNDQEMEKMSCSSKDESGGEEEKGKKSGLRELDSLTNSNSKPVRESKIGMKKPRERLGERLGAKRLGSRIEKKTLEGISSDSIISSKEYSSETEKSFSKSTLGMQKTGLEEKNDTSEIIQDKLKDEHWKDQQQRWQQIHSQENERKHISSEDDRGDEGWGGSWGGWGSTLFSAASTFTREVGRGVETVMETVEGSLGVPDPQTMAREIAEHEKKLEHEERCVTNKAVEEIQEPAKGDSLNSIRADMASSDDDGNEDVKNVVDYGISGLSSLGFLVSGVSGALETASSKVLLGGLDTLEVIGRKAMNVIQEGDPGLRKKRALLENRKPNLSLILQEARQRAEEESKNQTGDHERESKNLHKPTFYQAWEATEGPVHIEALSLIARQCESKMTSMLQSLPHYLLDKIQAANSEIKIACKLDEDTHFEGDLVEHLTNVLPKAGLPLHFEKINMAWSAVEDTASIIQEAGVVDGPSAEQELFKVLAALVVQLSTVIHKGAELSLITPQADPLTVALHFKELTDAVCGGIEDIADQVCEAITAGASPADPQVNNTITNIYLQATSGNSYISQSMFFMSSVLQYANTKQMAADVS